MSSSEDLGRSLEITRFGEAPTVRMKLSPAGIRAEDPLAMVAYLISRLRLRDGEAGMPPADAARRALRTLLKAACLPDRLTAVGDVEAWDGRAWTSVPLPWEF